VDTQNQSLEAGCFGGIFERPIGTLRYNQDQMSDKLGIRLGTSVFTAVGGEGAFYPPGTKPPLR
jgi:hypothetical protein